jgi:hypothetical protein
VHFERLAEEAGLAKPLMKRRVLELADSLRTRLPSEKRRSRAAPRDG